MPEAEAACPTLVPRLILASKTDNYPCALDGAAPRGARGGAVEQQFLAARPRLRGALRSQRARLEHCAECASAKDSLIGARGCVYRAPPHSLIIS